MPSPYKRVMLKLSGEVFGGGHVGVDPDVVAGLAAQIAAVNQSGVQVAIVVGGGNFFRGAELQQRGMDRDRADYIGMLGTVMNCLALQDFCEKQGVQTRVQTAIAMGQVAEPYIPRRAERHLEKGRVVIFGAGSGMPYFSTDTVAAQRALEISAEVLLMGKQGVDGVYSADPKTHPDAVKFEDLSYDEYLARNLKVADATAISMARDYKLPMIFFSLDTDGTIVRVVSGERIGTTVHARNGADQQGEISVIDDIMAEAELKMEDAIEYAKEEFAAIRTGRAHPAMFAKLTAEYYGAQTPLQQLATFQVPDARVVMITPYDASSMNSIERAIRDSNLGVNPSNDGKTIRVTLPQLTEERRKEYIKLARTKAEDARISVRGARRTAKEALDKLVKDKAVGEDEVTRAEKQLDVVTKKSTDVIDDVLKHKESELLEV